MRWGDESHEIIREDRLFLIATSIVWSLGLSVTLWDFLFIQARPHSIDVVNLVGAALLIIGIIIRTAARRTLGPFFSIFLRIKSDHRLITHGIYSKVRHPAYLGTIMLSLGIPLVLASILGFLVMLFLIPCIMYRITVEERMLITRFGAEYQNYRKRTKKLIPFVY